jgi:hypothetical protein
VRFTVDILAKLISFTTEKESVFRPRLSISTQSYRVNEFPHRYSTSPNALAMDGRGDSALSGLIIFLGPHSQGVALGYLIPPLWGLKRTRDSALSGLIIFLGPHSQGVALGYLIPPRWGLKLILLSHILLKILFLQAMLYNVGA